MSITELSLIAFLPPLVGQLRGARPSAVAALAALGAAGVALVQMAVLLGPWREFALVPRGRAYHDTYYVVGHAHYLIFIAAIMAVLWGLLFLKVRVAGPLHDRFLGFALWAYLLSVLGTIAVQGLFARLLMPRRYVNYEGAFAYLNGVSVALSFLALAGLAALVTGVGAAFVRHWRR